MVEFFGPRWIQRQLVYNIYMKKLNRRTVIKSTLAGLTLAGSSFVYRQQFKNSKTDRSPASSEAPNILFMTADDIGWWDLSCYGNTNIQTPHLDKLASEGMKFNNAFGVSSSCSSSRASFITGQYITTHGVTGLTHRYLRRGLPPRRWTIADYFKRSGYFTAIEGKWHVVIPVVPPSLYGYGDSLGAVLPWKRHIKHTRNIRKFMEYSQREDVPFYLELNFTDTHRNASGKFKPDPDFQVDPNSIEVPEWMGLPNWEEIRADLALYYAKVQKTDQLVGETLQHLEELGMSDNTIVVFVSDNGSPFPGNKMTLYDRGIGTPLLIKYPKSIEAGSTSDALVSTIDILPTILDYAGIEQRSLIQGKSLMPILMGQTQDQHREQIFSEMVAHVSHQPMRAVRDKNFKAILNITDSPIGLDDLADQEWARRLCERADQPWLRKRVPFELYDLNTDPYETNNLAGNQEFAEVESRYRDILSKDLG